MNTRTDGCRPTIEAVNTEHILRRHFDEHALDVMARIHGRCIELAQAAEDKDSRQAGELVAASQGEDHGQDDGRSTSTQE